MLQHDRSPIADMFRILLKESGLTWNLQDMPGNVCDLEGTWEAMLKGYVIFSAMQTAGMEVANDVNSLYKWVQDCNRKVDVIPLNDIDGQTFKYILQTPVATGFNHNSSAQLDKVGYQDSLLNTGPQYHSQNSMFGSIQGQITGFSDLPKGESSNEGKMDFDKMFRSTDIEIDKMSEPDENFTNISDTNHDEGDEGNTEDSNSTSAHALNGHGHGKMKVESRTENKTRYAKKKSKEKSKPWQNLHAKKNFGLYYRNKIAQRQVIKSKFLIILFRFGGLHLISLYQ